MVLLGRHHCARRMGLAILRGKSTGITDLRSSREFLCRTGAPTGHLYFVSDSWDQDIEANAQPDSMKLSLVSCRVHVSASRTGKSNQDGQRNNLQAEALTF
jgi:hypothetical protein